MPVSVYACRRLPVYLCRLMLMVRGQRTAREALKALLNHQYAFEGNRTDKLIEAASGTFLRLRQAGWPESEFGAEGRLLFSGVSKMQTSLN